MAVRSGTVNANGRYSWRIVLRMIVGKRTGRNRVIKGHMSEHVPVFGALSFLVLVATVSAFTLGHSQALAQQPRLAAQGNAAAGNSDNGKKVFSAQKCEECHGSQGQGGTGSIAAPRIGPPRLALPLFLDAVRNAKAPMPSYSSTAVPDAALADVYAFLNSVTPAQGNAVAVPSGNAANGNVLYVKAGCYECHDRQGQGGTGTGPRSAPNPIAFLAFVHQCRQPVNEMPPYTSKVLSDAGLADIYAYLQSIPQPPAASSIPILQ